MIKSFRCPDTERLFERIPCRKYRHIERQVRRKLELLDAAKSLEDLKSPPGNRLESLKGDREGSFSIRINQQYRLCFVWKETDVFEVEIVEYHP